MTSSNLNCVEIKAFVPAKDFLLSQQFYQAIGFSLAWASDGLAYLHHGRCSFLLQNFHVQQHTDNFMMHMVVENADDWHRQIQDSGATEKFGGKLGDPEDQPWGMRDFTLHDPSGVLWRIGHDLPVTV